MAFSKYAKARVTNATINQAVWEDIRAKASIPAPTFDLRKASQVVLQQYDPGQYLLSHCTIIASVDTETPVGMPTGKQMFDGTQIDRKYPDFYITAGTTKYINNNCFVSGTQILMGDGTEKSIEDVKVGDRVVSHTGNVRRVIETFIKPFNGYLSVIRRLGDQRDLEVTPEHPLYAMTPAQTCACGCGTRLNRGSRKAAIHRFQDYVRGHGCKERKNPKPDYTWVSAGFLNKGDFLSTPRLQGEVVESGITLGKARLLGYYLAEGYYHRQKRNRLSKKYLGSSSEVSVPVGIDFALCLDETDTLVSEIQRLLQEEFGVGSSVNQVSANGVSVYSQQSVELVSFFKSHATEYAKSKKLAEHVLRWPIHLQRELVQGWLEGDGCVQSTAGGWVTVTSASSDLISQMHIILGRLGVFATRGYTRSCGRKRVREANGGFVVTNDPTKVCHTYHLQIGSVHAEALMGGSFLSALFSRSTQGRKKNSLGFRVRSDRTTFPIRSVTKRFFDGSVYNFETEEDHSYVANGVAVHNCDAWERKLLMSSFRTFIGGENYVEHIQIPELSKGKIIDAAARDIGDSVYVDILIATDRKHRELIAAILDGTLSTLSMGCHVGHTTCTKCGNVAEDETNLCRHIKYEKGQWFIDASGTRRKVAELCGHISAEPGSVKFIEGSWVANPAFVGAVLNKILDPKTALMAEQARQKIQVAFSRPVEVFDVNTMQKAARVMTRRNVKAIPGDHLAYLYSGPSLGSLKAPPAFSGSERASKSLEERLNQINQAYEQSNVHSAQQQDFPGQSDFTDSAPSAAPTEDKEHPFKKTIDDLYGAIVDEVTKKVKKDLADAGKDKDQSVIDPNHSNESLIKSALKYPKWIERAQVVAANIKDGRAAKSVLAGLILHDVGGWEAVAQAKRFRGSEILVMCRLLERTVKKSSLAGDTRIYKTVIAVGGTRSYPNVDDYLTACSEVMGRTPIVSERAQLIEKGKLFSLGIQ
jgi:hypothetical protein